jgi:carboxymethylenebutenolidase
MGTISIADELLLNVTHDRQIDFLLPGVKPTNSYIQIPICFSVSFRGDKLARVRVYFDPASVMKQAGLTEKDLAVRGREITKKLEDDSFKIDSMVAP